MIDLRKIAIWPAAGGAPAPVLQVKGVTPDAAGFSVTPDEGYDGLAQVDVAGDENLVADNIKKDVTIFGVTGTLSEGAGPVDPDAAVLFIDYDGWPVYSFNRADFAALDAMPAVPAHDGLVAQGWNWTLEDAKAFVAAGATVTIGPLYTTADNRTHIRIVIPSDAYDVAIKNNSSNVVTVDWGDGSAESSGSGLAHRYAKRGEYIVRVSGSDQAIMFYDNTTWSYKLTGLIREINFAGATVVDTSVYENHACLEKVSFCNTITTIGNKAFSGCRALMSVTLPEAATIGSSAFQSISAQYVSVSGSASGMFRYCQSIRRFEGRGITTTTDYMIQGAYMLSRIVLPSTTNYISQNSWSVGYRFRTLVCLAATPPALNFGMIDGAVDIYVPDASVAAYKAASNWNSFQNNIHPISEFI